jgi:hypothetical protein
MYLTVISFLTSEQESPGTKFCLKAGEEVQWETDR